MSVSIRLSKTGKRNFPSYRIVVANKQNKREGKFLDIIGHYSPLLKKDKFVLDKESLKAWEKKGALVSKAVQSLILGTNTFTKYNPRKEVGKENK